MPSLIIVPGAWHTEFHVQPILPFLKGYRTVVVPLPTTLDPSKTFDDNVAAVLRALQKEQDPILIGHSVSGHACAAAVNAYKTNIRMILIACFYNPTRPFDNNIFFEINWDTWEATLARPAAEVFYNDMPAEEAEPFVKELKYNRASMFPETESMDWKQNATYVLTTKDKAIFPDKQRMEAEDLGLKIVEFDGDHCPFTSQPEKFAECLISLINQ